MQTSIQAEQKDLHFMLNKFGKLLDKTFTGDIGKVGNQSIFPQNDLNLAISQHLYRQGRFTIAENFTNDAKCEVIDLYKEPFIELYQIMEGLKSRKNLIPAITWAQNKRSQLETQGSNLEFKLHKLYYIQFLSSGNRKEALQYARKNFPHFASGHLKEIQRLMASLLFINRLDKSPYSDFLSPILWSDIVHTFTGTACALLGLSQESPLFISITAGYTALPHLMKFSQVMKGKPTDWNAALLPVEIDLGSEYQFHSIFTCPVSREQSSKENPPVLLVCGHVLCKVSMSKLAKGRDNRFKCPYCPVDQLLTQAINIQF